MIFLIVGRSASGKDYLRHILEKEYGWSFVLSTTTRPRRFPEEDTHIFVSPDVASTIPITDQAAWTTINGYEYYCTKQQINEANAYIIDPNGIQTLRSTMPELKYQIIYLIPGDMVTCRQYAIIRGDDSITYDSRMLAEDEQFKQFEKSDEFQNCIKFTNTYHDKDMIDFACYINSLSNKG